MEVGCIRVRTSKAARGGPTFAIPVAPDCAITLSKDYSNNFCSDLQRHRAVHYFSSTTPRGGELTFGQDGTSIAVPLPGAAAVNETGLYIRLCFDGPGLAQLAEILVKDQLQAGELAEVLADKRPPPVRYPCSPPLPLCLAGEAGVRRLDGRAILQHRAAMKAPPLHWRTHGFKPSAPSLLRVPAT